MSEQDQIDLDGCPRELHLLGKCRRLTITVDTGLPVSTPAPSPPIEAPRDPVEALTKARELLNRARPFVHASGSFGKVLVRDIDEWLARSALGKPR